MSENPAPAVCSCPRCHAPCAWTAERAGRRLRCPCGQILRLPDAAGGTAVAEAAPPSPSVTPVTPGPPEPDRAPLSEALFGSETEPEPETYEIDLPDDLAAIEARSAEAASGAVAAGGLVGATKCPACNGRLRAGAVVCMNCGFNLAEGGKIKTQIETAPVPGGSPAPGRPAAATAGAGVDGISDERLKRALARTAGEQEETAARERRFHFQENVLPLILIGAGLLVAVFNALVLSRPSLNASLTADEVAQGLGVTWGAAVAAYFSEAGQLLLVQIPCLFAGLFVCVSLMGSAFGTLGTVLKKLLALALLGGSFYLSISMGVNVLMYGMGGLGGMFTASVAIAIFWGVIVLLFDDLEILEVIILYVAMCVLPFWILTVIRLFTMG